MIKYAANSDEIAQNSDNSALGIDIKAKNVVKYLSEKGMKLCCAESCTGGLLCAAVTSVSGASNVFELGIVSYSNRIKASELGVSEDTLNSFGAVSSQTAEEMALGALRKSGADIAASVTGIAGPTGGTEHTPVGTVWVCVTDGKRNIIRDLKLYDEAKKGREKVRLKTVQRTLEMISELLNSRK